MNWRSEGAGHRRDVCRPSDDAAEHETDMSDVAAPRFASSSRWPNDAQGLAEQILRVLPVVAGLFRDRGQSRYRLSLRHQVGQLLTAHHPLCFTDRYRARNAGAQRPPAWWPPGKHGPRRLWRRAASAPELARIGRTWLISAKSVGERVQIERAAESRYGPRTVPAPYPSP